MPRNTAPGSNPDTNVTVYATLISYLANGPIHTSITVANRVALHNRMLPVNNLGRGLLTTRHNKVGAILVPFRGGHSLRRVPSGMVTSLSVRPIGHVRRILALTLRGRPSNVRIIATG